MSSARLGVTPVTPATVSLLLGVFRVVMAVRRLIKTQGPAANRWSGDFQRRFQACRSTPGSSCTDLNIIRKSVARLIWRGARRPSLPSSDRLLVMSFSADVFSRTTTLFINYNKKKIPRFSVLWSIFVMLTPPVSGKSKKNYTFPTLYTVPFIFLS